MKIMHSTYKNTARLVTLSSLAITVAEEYF